MPLYEYECDACGHRFEIIQKFADPPIETCPVCGGAVHKVQSAPAFHLKGSGWYVTDYAKKDQGGAKAEPGSPDTKDTKDGKETKDSKEKPGDAAASKTETKTEKTETKTDKPATTTKPT